MSTTTIKRGPEERAFARGYGAALEHVDGLRHQYWPLEAQASIDKLMAQIKNCLAPKNKISETYALMTRQEQSK